MADGKKTYETNMKDLNSSSNSYNVLQNMVQDLNKTIQIHLECVALSTQKRKSN